MQDHQTCHGQALEGKVLLHPREHAGKDRCLVWTCIYLLSLLPDHNFIEGHNLSSVTKNNEEIFLLLPFCIRPDKATDILQLCFQPPHLSCNQPF